MRIAVLIPSRGRPFQLQTALRHLVQKAMGLHHISYVIGCDADDPKTIAMAHILRLEIPNVSAKVMVRQASLGGIVNTLSDTVEADVYCSLCDDIEVTSPGWDEHIAFAWRADPRGVWFWRCPSNATFAIVSANWKRAAGRIFTDYFPFWYDDMWLLELWRLTTGEQHRVISATLEDKAPGTHRMRDIQFWCDFFLARKAERRAEAIRIAGLLGYTPAADPDFHELRPNDTFKHEETEAKQGEKRPPTPEYLRAYHRAERLMAA